MRLRFAVLLAAAAMAAPQAQARDGRNGALAIGLAAGAFGGALLMNSTRPSRAVPMADDAVVEVEPPPRYAPTCHMERRRVWIDSESYTYKRVEICE